MRINGVCPICGVSVRFYIADDRSRVCPNCGHLIDIDDITEEKE